MISLFYMNFLIDPITVVKEVYALSNPQGLGYLQYTAIPLKDKEFISCIIDNDNKDLTVEENRLNIKQGRIAIDYLKGRSCKFYASINNKYVKILINKNSWERHTNDDLQTLIKFLTSHSKDISIESQ